MASFFKYFQTQFSIKFGEQSSNFMLLKIINYALAGVAQWIEH